MPISREVGQLSGGQGGGGSAESQGAMIHQYFDFDFTLANLFNGASFYTPNVGEYLYNLWVEIHSIWACSPPATLGLDVGTFIADAGGWYENGVSAPLNVNQPDAAVLEPPYLGPITGYNNAPDILGTAATAYMSTNVVPVADNPNFPSAWTASANTSGVLSPQLTNPVGWGLPGHFASANPLKVCINSNFGLALCSAFVTATNAPIPFPITVTGSNNTFRFGPAGSELTYTVANGTYSNLAALATAMSAALSGGNPLSNVCTIYPSGTFNSLNKLCAVATVPGTGANGDDFLTGLSNDFLVSTSGFANAQALGGGNSPTNPNLISGSARVNIITTHPVLVH